MTAENGTKESFAKVIDVRGLYCPEPVFRTKIEIENFNIDDITEPEDGPTNKPSL